jgi:nitroreductase
MSFIELAKSRYSCRIYKNKPIEQDKILRVLEAGRIAPSAANKQPWLFIYIDRSPLLQEIKKCYKSSWLESAPSVIVVCGNHNRSWKRDDGKDHCDIDIAIATDHITLAATDEGLATCWVCRFDSIRCAEILQLPPLMEVMVILSIGYPDDKGDPNRYDSQRLPTDKIALWNNRPFLSKT